jgi:hypothetical protein
MLLSLAMGAGPGETKLALTPAAAPVPALRYQLLPEVRELTPGNSVQWYLRCFAEQRNFFFGKDGVAERNRYRAMRLAELEKEDLRKYGGHALTQADWAARLEYRDWNVLPNLETEGSALRLPELDGFRVLAVSLQIRLRACVAKKDWDAAIETAKTMFAFARHLGEHPTAAGNQLGLEVAHLALDSLEEMIQQPGSPNLYWALVNLPSPLVELRKGLEGERVRVDADLRGLKADEVMTDEQLEAFVAALSGRIGTVREAAGLPPRNVRAAIAKLVQDRERAGRIRARLLKEAPAGGVQEKLAALKILQYSPLQLVLLDERREYEERRDDVLKLLGMAPWQIDALPESPRGEGLLTDFVQPVAAQRRAQARVDQRVALLAAIESIRMGKRDSVSMPTDPFTGKPFSYDGTKLTAHGKTYEIILK